MTEGSQYNPTPIEFLLWPQRRRHTQPSHPTQTHASQQCLRSCPGIMREIVGVIPTLLCMRARPMHQNLRPIRQAHPTKFLSTSRAGHMIASTPLMNSGATTAVRTRFRDLVDDILTRRIFARLTLSSSPPLSIRAIILLARLAFVPVYAVPETMSVAAGFACEVWVSVQVDLAAGAARVHAPLKCVVLAEDLAGEEVVVAGEGDPVGEALGFVV